MSFFAKGLDKNTQKLEIMLFKFVHNKMIGGCFTFTVDTTIPQLAQSWQHAIYVT